MSQYSTYPKLWKPEENPTLFMIRVPAETTQLSWQAYQRLLGERLDWMIQTWMEQTGETQAQTHQRLAQALTRLLSYQDVPRLKERTNELVPLWEWIAEWVETFLERNETLTLKLALDFPILQMDLETLQTEINQHDSISLDDWLTDLTKDLTTESIL
jgi:hypothetical protein